MKPSLFSNQTLQFDISPLLETVRKILYFRNGTQNFMLLTVI